MCMCVCVQEVIAEGYSGSQTLSQLHSRIVSMDTLTDKQKSIVAERMGVSSSQYVYIHFRTTDMFIHVTMFSNMRWR